MSDAVVLLLGAVIAWGLVHGIRRWAQGLGLVDRPTPRSMHWQPTPRGGGAAIVTVCLIGVIGAAAVGFRPEWSVLLGYLAGALLIACVSWTDDIRSVPPGIRLSVHVVAAALMIAGLGIQSHAQALVGRPELTWLVVAAGLLWTVGLTNAYNFMDGIDGLAAVQGLVAGLGWTLLASLSHQPWIAFVALLLAAGCAGFLVHNWSPARIFMGDVGSAFLGFTFAFITLAAAQRLPKFAFVGGLLLWPFIFDSAFTLVRRVGRGENILVAHRSHLYQRLVLAGWRHGSVTTLYGGLTAVSVGLTLVWWITDSDYVAYTVAGVVALLSLLFWATVTRTERATGGTGDSRSLMNR